MYFVDRKNIEQILDHMSWCTDIFVHHLAWEKPIDQLALERLAHVMIEAIIDVGHQIIDGFIMRDPGGYTDIIDVLCDEGVFDSEDARILKDVVAQRKTLVRNYTAVDHEELREMMASSLFVLERFPRVVRRYLDEELGPVSAFLSENENEVQE